MVKAALGTKQKSRKSSPARAAKTNAKTIKPLPSTKAVQDALQEVLKPRRALTAYNLFTGLERERILNGTDKLGLPVTAEDVYRISLQHKEKKRRVHRKSHGVIGFQELSKTIALRWKALTEEQRRVFEHQAELEKLERQARLRVWKAQQRKANKKTPTMPPTEKSLSGAEGSVDEDEGSVPKDASTLQTASQEALLKMKSLVDGKVAALLEMSKVIDQKLGILHGGDPPAGNGADNTDLLEEAGEMMDEEFAKLFDQAEGALELEETDQAPLHATTLAEEDQLVHVSNEGAGTSPYSSSDSEYEYESSSLTNEDFSGDEADSFMASLGPIQMECL
mmetsp:Transcript_17530/g.40827  ORF Transcript_17530/g.40827 Transcript_17530/m.40827 type:complete len:336 (-) Transcript_17530:115-1122(-)